MDFESGNGGQAHSWHCEKVLITVRTYPNPARKGIEVSCTAGITESGEWRRLYPIPYRFLSFDKRFRKYQWIEANARKGSDPRPESYNVDIESIHICSEPLSTSNKWRDRKRILSPLEAPSLCHLQKAPKGSRKPSLGFFKPKSIGALTIEKEGSPDWTLEEHQKLLQTDLFGKTPPHPLEKIPYRFSYKFTCDEPNCTGHQLMCTDWEIGEAYRKWRPSYGTRWEWAIRNRFETQMAIERDTHFFVGTLRSYPNTWIIVGLFYPPK